MSSKDPVSQRNELLCKIISYNLTVLIHEAFEHGIPIPGGPTSKDSMRKAPAERTEHLPRPDQRVRNLTTRTSGSGGNN